MLRLIIFFYILSATGCSALVTDNLADDLNTFQKWLPGLYNNDKQFNAALKSSPHDQLAERLRVSTDRNIKDILGPFVIEHRMYQKGDMEKVYRHLFLTFEMD